MKRVWHIARNVFYLCAGTLLAAPFFLLLFGSLLAIVSAFAGFESGLTIGKSMCGLGGIGIAALFFTDFGQIVMQAVKMSGKSSDTNQPAKDGEVADEMTSRSYGRGMWRSSPSPVQGSSGSKKPNRFWGL